jgi:DNA-binding NtrC family response regulator
MQLLASHNWPGNVRKLENTMERAACLAGDNCIDAETIAASLQRLSNQPNPALQKLLGDRSSHEGHLVEQERRYLVDLLRRHRGNITRAAQEAKMGRQGLHKALSRLGIEPIAFR